MKCGSLPAKADTKKQGEFYDETLHPLMEKAKNGDIALLFLDASHFVMGCNHLGYVYGKVRRYIMTFSGRMRYNVLGALDYTSKKVLAVTNESYITATEVCEMLRKIKSEYGRKEVHLVLDNARYQKCQVVRELASKLEIYLEYIPPYSPNLNLIERFWKYIKGELSKKYYSDFETFKLKIDTLIDSADKQNKAKIDSLIGKGVQLFRDLIPIGECSFALLDGETCTT